MDKLGIHNPKTYAASDLLEQTINNNEDTAITIAEIVYALHARGFGLLMMILVLPNCVPVPLPPGISTVFSIPLIYLSVQMMAGLNTPRLPEWLMRRSFERRTLARMVTFIVPRLRKIEKLLKPRLSLAVSKRAERVLGVFWLAFSLCIALPIPGTHFIPGVGILISSLGLLAADGFVLMLGLLVGVFGVAISFGIVVFGVKVVHHFLPFLRHIA